MKRFEGAVQALCDAGVEFVVIGGFAANLLGSRRTTYYVDVLDLPALIASKKAAGRGNDLEALLELEGLLEAQEPDSPNS
jgi:hypothetical protein